VDGAGLLRLTVQVQKACGSAKVTILVDADVSYYESKAGRRRRIGGFGGKEAA
jgi:ribosomal protein S6E (S10)